jgi:hypothetical protein
LTKKSALESLDDFLKYCFIAILVLAALAFFFVFVINWEDWFFGIKLDGTAAGISLLIKWLCAAVLLYLVIRYPRFVEYLAVLGAIYLGFLFIDSAVTVQKLSSGRQSFSALLGLFAMIPIVFFIIHKIVKRRNLSTAGDEFHKE